MKICLWKICHKSIPTKEILFIRKILLTSMCLRCNMHIESINHWFLTCDKSRQVWRHPLTSKWLTSKWLDCTLPLDDFFVTLDYRRKDRIALHKFMFLSWSIWKEINDCVFSNTTVSVCRCYFKAANAYKEWELRLHIDSHQLRGTPISANFISPTTPTSSSPIMVRWFPPPTGAFKHNFDSSCKSP